MESLEAKARFPKTKLSISIRPNEQWVDFSVRLPARLVMKLSDTSLRSAIAADRLREHRALSKRDLCVMLLLLLGMERAEGLEPVDYLED